LPTLLVVAVFFGATLVRSALGFGEALIAVPLLAFVLPVKVAAPIAAARRSSYRRLGRSSNGGALNQRERAASRATASGARTSS
jgi:uncharacterized membrane protein YfcA